MDADDEVAADDVGPAEAVAAIAWASSTGDAGSGGDGERLGAASPRASAEATGSSAAGA